MSELKYVTVNGLLKCKDAAKWCYQRYPYHGFYNNQDGFNYTDLNSHIDENQICRFVFNNSEVALEFALLWA